MLVWCSRAAALASRRNRSRAIAVARDMAGQDLQRHPAAQADLLGLVDHPHAAPADLAEDPVVAQPPLLARDRDQGRPLAVRARRRGSIDRSCSTITSAGSSSRIWSASSGWRAAYSSMLGRSPARYRARNDSATTSNGSRSAVGVAHDPSSATPPGQGGQDLLEPLQRPGVALARRRLLQAQGRGGVAVGHLLVVPQDQDLAVERVHAVERLLEPELPLGPHRRLAGAGQLAQEPGGQGPGAGAGHGAAVDRDLAADVAAGRPRCRRCCSCTRWPTRKRSQM